MTEIPADLRAAFDAYEAAILANDLDALDAAFAPGEGTIRADGAGLSGRSPRGLPAWLRDALPKLKLPQPGGGRSRTGPGRAQSSFWGSPGANLSSFCGGVVECGTR